MEKSNNLEKTKNIESLETKISNLSDLNKSLDQKINEMIQQISELENENAEASKPLLQDLEILCEENDQLKIKLIEIKSKFEIREKEILHDFDQLSKAFKEAKSSKKGFETVEKTNYKKHLNLTPDNRKESSSNKERELRHKVSHSSRSNQYDSHHNTKDDKVTVRKLVQVSMLESEIRDKDILIEKLCNNIKQQHSMINNLEREKDQLSYNNLHLMPRSSYRENSCNKPRSSVKISTNRSSGKKATRNLSDEIIATHNSNERQKKNISLNYLKNKSNYDKRHLRYRGDEDSGSEDVEQHGNKLNQSLKNMTDFIQNPKPKTQKTRKSMPIALDPEIQYNKHLKFSESWNENTKNANFIKDISNSGKNSI